MHARISFILPQFLGFWYTSHGRQYWILATTIDTLISFPEEELIDYTHRTQINRNPGSHGSCKTMGSLKSPCTATSIFMSIIKSWTSREPEGEGYLEIQAFCTVDSKKLEHGLGRFLLVSFFSRLWGWGTRSCRIYSINSCTPKTSLGIVSVWFWVGASCFGTLRGRSRGQDQAGIDLQEGARLYGRLDTQVLAVHPGRASFI